MEISNASAAGPSYGLLDMIFGSKPKEEPKDGQGFGALISMIAALKKDGADATSEGNRTEKEIAAGKEEVEYRFVGMPGMMSMMQQNNPQAQETAGVVPGMEGSKAQASSQAAQGVDPRLVNQMLREKGLPPLDPNELKLMESVNKKFSDQSMAPVGESRLPSDPQATVTPKALLAGAAAHDAQSLQQLQAAGAHAKQASVAAVAPEKFVSTEAYLKMHESVAQKDSQKGPMKSGQPGDQLMKLAPESGVLPGAAAMTAAVTGKGAERGVEGEARRGTLTGEAVSGDETKEKKGPDIKADLNRALTAVGGGDAGSQASGSNSLEKIVTLPSSSPTETNKALLGEVGLSLRQTALRGGGEMKLVIRPENMGEIKLQVGTKDGKVEVKMIADNKEVAELLRAGSKDLEKSLKEQHLELAKIDVSLVESGLTVKESNNSSFSDQMMQQNSQRDFAGAQGEGRQQDRGHPWENPHQGGGFQAFDTSDSRPMKSSSESATFRPEQKRMSGTTSKLDVVA